MRRLEFLGALVSAVTVRIRQVVKAEDVHQWTQGPFYITAASTWEEPQFYPPQSLVLVEHCVTCGVLRLPKALWKYEGDNLAAGEAR